MAKAHLNRLGSRLQLSTVSYLASVSSQLPKYLSVAEKTASGRPEGLLGTTPSVIDASE
jgi:hypothetical protein